MGPAALRARVPAEGQMAPPCPARAPGEDAELPAGLLAAWPSHHGVPCALCSSSFFQKSYCSAVSRLAPWACGRL